jgi:hypothetical protein
LTLLRVRQVEVNDSERERITGCLDLETLDSWFIRAVTVESTDALFAD